MRADEESIIRQCPLDAWGPLAREASPVNFVEPSNLMPCGKTRPLSPRAAKCMQKKMIISGKTKNRMSFLLFPCCGMFAKGFFEEK